MPAALLALSTGTVAIAQVLPNGNLAGPLYPQPGSGGLYPTPIPQQNVPRNAKDGRARPVISYPYFYERDYVPVEREIVREVAAQPAPPPPPPRKAYALGEMYDSLPSGCMKMLQGGGAYYNCSGEWYREVGARYLAVRMP
jgi:hypothetical protein